MYLLNINKLIAAISISILLSACSTMTAQHEDSTPVTASKTIVLPSMYPEALDAAKSGNTKSAIKLLTQVTSSNPEFAPAHTNLGLQHLRKNDFKSAEASFKKALEIDNSDAVAYNHLGVILRKQGKFKDAQVMYNNAIKQKPDYAIAHLNLGILYDIYLYELPLALEHYKRYQSITSDSDKQVSKWIIDLERRLKTDNKG